eukprot:353231-Chlamydomonas_euryale.AAC.3
MHVRRACQVGPFGGHARLAGMQGWRACQVGPFGGHACSKRSNAFKCDQTSSSSGRPTRSRLAGRPTVYLWDEGRVMSLLGLKGGPALGRAVADVMDWQLAHPGGSVEQVTEHLKAKHAAESAM